jgi:hypothetical protein
VRALSAIVLVAGLAFLGACGGSGTPAGIPITITLSASLTSLNPGQSSTITATVTNDSSNKGVTWTSSPSGFGTLSNQTATSVTFTAPASVPAATAVTITATSVASSTVTASIQISVQTSAITVSLSPAAPQTINQGQQLSINATLTNDTSKKGVTWSLSPAVGSLTNQTTAAATYVAPSTVTANTTVTVTATSVASSTAKTTLEITVFPSGAGPNVAAINVTGGPANSVNLAFVSVTICVPNTTTCQTVDNIQVDTGSAGLRILQSVIPGLSLPTLVDSNTGDTLYNCVSFLDTSYLWGPVQQADIKIGGEEASATNGELVQTVSNSNTGIPTACTNGGTVNENTPLLLGANGILGVGLEPTDCIVAGADFCDGSVSSSAPPVYFECPSSGCQSTDGPIVVPASAQVVNPVFLFTLDNNGVILQFPPVPSVAPTVRGSLIFGIETEANNGLGTATAFGLDTNDNFITAYEGQTLNASFIDSGSNALFFPSSLLAVCPDNASFFCPSGLTAQSATNAGASGAPTSVVNFSVDNADNLFNNNPPTDSAFGTLAGPQGTANTCTSTGGSCTFDWGLPFFFGRTVFTAIDGQTVPNVGVGPFWAY